MCARGKRKNKRESRRGTGPLAGVVAVATGDNLATESKEGGDMEKDTGFTMATGSPIPSQSLGGWVYHGGSSTTENLVLNKLSLHPTC